MIHLLGVFAVWKGRYCFVFLLGVILYYKGKKCKIHEGPKHWHQAWHEIRWILATKSKQKGISPRYFAVKMDSYYPKGALGAILLQLAEMWIMILWSYFGSILGTWRRSRFFGGLNNINLMCIKGGGIVGDCQNLLKWQYSHMNKNIIQTAKIGIDICEQSQKTRFSDGIFVEWVDGWSMCTRIMCIRPPPSSPHPSSCRIYEDCCWRLLYLTGSCQLAWDWDLSSQIISLIDHYLSAIIFQVKTVCNWFVMFTRSH